MPQGGVLPAVNGHWQAKQGHRERLPEHDHRSGFVAGQGLGDEEGGGKHGGGRQHDQGIDPTRPAQLRPHHHQHTGKADERRHPSVGPHFLAQKPGGPQHDEDRPGEPQRRHVGQGGVGQCREPEHQAPRVHRAAPELALDILGHVGRRLTQHPGQHHQHAKGVAQKERLIHIEVQGDAANHRVER